MILINFAMPIFISAFIKVRRATKTALASLSNRRKIHAHTDIRRTKRRDSLTRFH